ncbi:MULTISPECIES: DUF3352 domain-containing protein [Cyanophyceae]|uniref:DUF3352 domain-containing protein n=1 Tax=Cyanophyceae TaxID=3028117 RepID=UPI001682947D|nr:MULTISPECIES: DUF3352 domain-containing protein [Cyanophyceae]MBD1917637.1 DUF3352 domain-containing protein [Phormidium sp. FACHB-77]MBD2031184.1 DUF3352 domain-containing protein [Phormidium sp. FACHB-322]MBD2050748.1 DUF3352 domain-containing protein [Leptolyngbya sp. FACHB-60]
MKFRSFIRPLAIAAGLVLVLGLGLLWRLTLNTPLYLIERGGQAQPLALQFVPKQSPVVASVLVRPDRLASLWEYLAAPRLRQETHRDQELIEQALLANTGLSYSRDIQPWLGEEVTAAMVTPDLDQDPTDGSTPGYLVALSCNDSAAAQAALELYWQNRAIAGDALTFEEFSGNRLIYARRVTPRSSREETAQLATVLVANRYVLAANHPDVLRQALTAAQSTDLNLQSDRRYKTALRELPNQRVGLLALNLPAVSQWLNPDRNPNGAAVGLGKLGAADDQVGWGLMSWQLSREGLVGHTALLAAQGHRLHSQRARATDWENIVPYLPDSLAVTAVGSDLATLGQRFNPLLALLSPAGEGSFPLAKLIDGALGQGAMDLLQTGVDRAYGVGLGTAETGSPDWLVVAPQSETLTAALDGMTALAQKQGLGVGALDLRGTSAIAWTRLALPKTRGSQPLQVVAEVAGLYAQVDQYEALAASPATLDAVIRPTVVPRQYPVWWPQVAQVPGPSTGYVHIDWPQIQAGLATQLPRWRLWSAAAQPALKHLRQITLVSGDRSDAMQTGSILVQLSNQS